MKYLGVCCVIMYLITLSGCVYLDIASQDTAVPVYPKKFGASVHLTNGVNISDTYYESGEDDPDPNLVRHTILSCGKATVGVSPRTDVIINLPVHRAMSGLLGLVVNHQGITIVCK